MKWFTADTHLGHNNIIRYCDRPFISHEVMDEEILRRFNEHILPGDELYHLGDVSWSSFALREWLDRLRCGQVHLIMGNHDKHLTKFTHPKLVSRCDLRNLTVPGYPPAVLCHYAMRSWLGKMHGAYQLYGHSHGKLPPEGRQMDVGVDTNNFYPYSWEDIHARLSQQPCGLE